MCARVCLAAVLFFLLAPSTSFAQNVFFEETFDGGIPPTWANLQLGQSSDVWLPASGQVNGTPCVYHESFCNSGFHFRDNILLSPPINLSGLSQASFACEQVQGGASSIFYNKIEVTTDGGQSYTVIKDLAGSPEGFSAVTANMDAFAGLPSVQVALHYKGTIANNWWVDNVRVLTGNSVFCFGDGSAGACPCGNNGSPGAGCENSASTGGAVLTATGSSSLSGDTLVLTSSGELPTVVSVFLQGDVAIAGVNFGDGLRCVHGNLKRLYMKNASGGVVSAPQAGDPSISTRSAALGDSIPTGATRYYQTHYRDPSLAFCPNPPGNSWNISNGLSAVWSP